jgi:hypothetical protein
VSFCKHLVKLSDCLSDEASSILVRSAELGGPLVALRGCEPRRRGFNSHLTPVRMVIQASLLQFSHTV